MRDAFFEELSLIGSADPRLMFLTADLGFKLFDGFATACPGRCLNMGVSEANMVSVAAGLALSGMRPVTYSIVPFATVRCLEQIRNDVCNQGVAVIVVGVGGGYAYGVNGPTHHGVDDVAVMRAMPGMTVLAPCDPPETREALRAAVRIGGPVYLRLGRNKEPVLTAGATAFELGVPRQLRPGRGAAILACGPIAKDALDAAATLASRGIDAAVWSVHTVKPIAGLSQVLRGLKYEHLFVVEEHGPCGGLAEALAMELAGAPGSPRLTRIGAPDHFFHECGSQAHMKKLAGIDAPAIARRISEVLGVPA